MKTSARAKRDLDAQNQIVANINTLARLLGMPRGVGEGVLPLHRDPEIRAMLQHEALAALLGTFVEAVKRKVAREKRLAKEAKKRAEQKVASEE